MGCGTSSCTTQLPETLCLLFRCHLQGCITQRGAPRIIQVMPVGTSNSAKTHRKEGTE